MEYKNIEEINEIVQKECLSLNDKIIIWKNRLVLLIDVYNPRLGPFRKIDKENLNDLFEMFN